MWTAATAGEVVVSRGDRHPSGECLGGELPAVGLRGQRHPEVVSTARVVGEFGREGRGDGIAGGRAPVFESLAESRQPTSPRRRGHHLQGGVLQWCGNQHGVDDRRRAQTGHDGPACGDGSHPQVGRRHLGHRAYVHHGAIGIVGDQWRHKRFAVIVGHVPGEVVLDQECSVPAGYLAEFVAALRCEAGTRWVLEEGLHDDRASVRM
ncbi:Uncharacterised protein [Mycobacteroides abscessus subsp. abscessus]|nr:Uncharacterised protein [Mycobacteroides abscessus subsp. abscessus]